MSATVSRLWSCDDELKFWFWSLTFGVHKILDKSMFFAFQWLIASCFNNKSDLPIKSLNFSIPSEAIIFLTSSAIRKKKFMTFSGVPINFFLSVSFCVAMPTGQVFRWHFLIIMHPIETNGAVENPNSSAPNNAPTTTSLPVFKPPSTWRDILSLNLFKTRVWWVSARPNSQGVPAFLIEVKGDAPVPPSYPAIVMWSALHFVTPAATTPTPNSDTNLTLILASGFTFFKSKINWAKSSIE